MGVGNGALKHVAAEAGIELLKVGGIQALLLWCFAVGALFILPIVTS